MHRRRPLLACLCTLALAGCGHGHPKQPSEVGQVEQTVRAYVQAQVAGDGPAACALLTTGAQQQLVSLVVKAARGLIPIRPRCADAVKLVRAVAGTSLLSALASARIVNVRIVGATGAAEVVDGTQFPPQRVTLTKLGGAWKISGVPGLGT